MKRNIFILLCVVLVLSLLTSCALIASTDLFGQDTQTEEQSEYIAKLSEVVELLEAVYVDGYSTEELGDYLAAAAVQATGDRWSYYISADEYAQYLEEGANEYVGIGITIQTEVAEDKGFLILEVNPSGPAFAAGLQANDYIIAVDGESVLEMDQETLASCIRGIEGTEVALTVEREGKRFDVTVTRATIEAVIVEYSLIDTVGYVKIANFQQHSADRTIEALEELLKQGAQSFVFDVRNNPGGRVTELVAVLDYLLPEGVVFRSVDYKGKESLEYSDAESKLEMPMAVLVNEDSYSAAELFAAVLQEYEWATVFGTGTSGKGNYQQTFSLSDGSAVAVSTGHYTTPNGVNLEGVGITPDMEIDVDDETYYKIYYGLLAKEDDIQLQAAIESLTE